MEEQLIIEIWDTFRDYIPEKGRDTAASQFLDFLVSKDVETETLESLLGFDPSLDTAIELVLKEFHSDTDEYNDDLDFDDIDEDDEDY
jgi:hypothetical protein